jgi:predicted HD superfamily hydrolase involved in NAD metabolism
MNMDFIENDVKKKLSRERYLHTLGVVGQAMKLAEKYGCDREKIYISALLHDIGKSLTLEEQVKMLSDKGYDKYFLSFSEILHAPCGRIITETDFGIKDNEILEAIESHTCGKEDMGILQKIIFVADATEPGRCFPGVGGLREAVDKNLDTAVYECLKGTIDKISGEGGRIYEETLKAYRYYQSLLDLK